ncbi:hypothetical protein BTW10_14175 [Chromohalobacter japonicus]|uniref:Uncharacterized protein n=1 Tax=Chromohalobacter japonicus TaxID=223900 RepID=A0A1Q8T9Y9_9GAMM|nr:hypothetical protein [Chromohalobacter japonicus]OLO10499.1 hypothetical protein BTW10_14175 [Chromohalobacter japonicus]
MQVRRERWPLRNGHQAVAFYPVAWRFPEQLADALTLLAYEEWPFAERYEGRSPKTRWGRLGFELIPTDGPLHWMPGLFVGVILDGAITWCRTGIPTG